MAAITENSIAQITLPVGTTAQFDAHKVAGFTGWNTDLGALVTCPGDGADFVAVGGVGPSISEYYECSDTYVDYSETVSGFILANNATESPIPANTLSSGSVIEMSAMFRAVVPEYADMNFGLSDSPLSQYPSGGVFTSNSIGGAGIWPTFTDSDVRVQCTVSIGSAISGTTHKAHVVVEMFRLDTQESRWFSAVNYSVDVSAPLYPHISMDLFGSGAMHRRTYSRRLYIP